MDDNVCELSIEETNKLREKLGLKKLEITKDNVKKNEDHDDEKAGKNKRKNSSNNKTKQIEKEEEHDEHVQNTTKKKQKIKSISEDYKDDVNDVEAWINKTRNTMNQRLEQDEIKYSDDENEEQSYNKKNKKKKKKNSNDNENFVSKVKVEHKNEDITEDMILTLKDQNVLNSDQEDCLINEELKKKNMKSLLSKKDDNYWTKNYYDPLSYYDDNNNNNNNLVDNSSMKMLPKYKDEKHSFDVNVTYEKTQTKYKHEKDTERKKKKNEYNNENNSIRNNKNENHETNHMVQLKKRKIKNINKRKKEEDAWDFLYNDNTEEDNQESDTTNKLDESKKKEKILRQRRDERDEHYEHDERDGRDGRDGRDEQEQNIDILNDVINKIKEEQMDMDINYFVNPFSDNEDDKELYELLQKGNNLQKRKKEKNYENELLKYIVVNEDEKSQKNKNKNNDKNNDNDHSDDDDDYHNHYNSNNVIKLTNTSEFCKNISLPLDVLENEKKLKSKKKTDNAKEGDNHLNDEYNSSNKNILEENINEDILKNTFLENEEDHNDDNSSELHGVSEIFNEVKLDEGLFGALEYLKTKGELNMEDKIYRNPENKPLHMSTDKDDIKLDYKNEFGKVMTPKESFRYISWIFHGKKQGKNKLEKKIKRLEIERRYKENPIDSLPTLNVLKKYQQMQKKSYFTLSNNN
ncbi:U4/U6.U5 tri-snRNP-associated protein 1, putative [Plasmodium reichenowi]|uniref:U4/U6.U5 tri-snRNP-associated protein 1, putative n=1 Tax=Plasmodium reichenowi TaxID=5854 RepID=A0A2P9D6J5_PLARE|nr:U4/U6.U5 tri-snRNP-associated protein 1, putative [Plasmodium reichenowi]